MRASWGRVGHKERESARDLIGRKRNTPKKNEHNNIKRRAFGLLNCWLLPRSSHTIAFARQSHFTFPQKSSSWEHVQHLTEKLMYVVVRVLLYIFCQSVQKNQADNRPSSSGRDRRCVSRDRIDLQLAGKLVQTNLPRATNKHLSHGHACILLNRI